MSHLFKTVLSSILLFGLLLTLDDSGVVAFAPLVVVSPSSISTTTTSLNGLFGGLSDAFKK
jgi:hypothetical protein